MNYLVHPITNPDRRKILAALALFRRLRVGLLEDAQFAARQLAAESTQRRITLASAQRHRAAEEVQDRADSRVNACSNAIHALTEMLDYAHPECRDPEAH